MTATLTLTFDNLGEAAYLERGEWPSDAPLGRHPSVTVALPALLSALAEEGLTATFFVEASNVALYPAALQAIRDGGHELGHHAWRHEAWGGLRPEREAAILRRGLDAFATAGLTVTGFRPPGGELTPASPALLVAAGLRWCSPVGTQAPYVLDDGVAVIPFRWPLVDAYHVYGRFDLLRVEHGESPDAVAPEAMAQRVLAELAVLRREGGQRTLILHPFLSVDPATRAAVTGLLGEIGALARAGELEVGPGGPLAERLLAAVDPTV